MHLVSYAQFLEDVRLFRALQSVDNGFYIDVGANHPLDHSVTKLFYERGWSGINIEPSPRWFSELVRDRPRDVNLRLAASAAAGNALFHDLADTGLSTLVASYADRHVAAGYHRTSYLVETRPLADICREHVHGEVHFLKIDVEGAEEDVIKGCDFTTCRPWILMIEGTEPGTTIDSYQGWEPTLFANNYLYAGADRVNRFYVAKEHDDLLPLLSMPADDYKLSEDATALAKAQRTIDQLRGQHQALRDTHTLEISAARQEIEALHVATAAEVGTLKQQIADLQGAKAEMEHALNNRINELEEAATRKTAEYDRVLSSRSWRLTQPLRNALQVLRYFRRRLPLRGPP